MLILIPVQWFFSQKELHLRGKDNFRITKFGNGKVWMWKKTKSLTFTFLHARKNPF